MSPNSTRNIRDRNGRATLFNKSAKRSQLRRIIREVELLEGDVQRRYEQAAGVHPCYAGTLGDVGHHVREARASLAEALAHLS